MSITHTESSDLWERIETFVAASMSSELTVSQLAELEHLLRESREARCLYATLVEMSVVLPHALVRVEDKSNREGINRDHWAIDDIYDASVIPEIFVDTTSHSALPALPDYGFLGGTTHTPLRHSFQDWSLAYLVASVLLAVGLVIGMAVRISNWQPERIASDHLRSEQMVSHDNTKTVGRVTDLANCQGQRWSAARGQWLDIPNNQSEITNSKFSIGDRFDLSSGLVEITYETGAKVILQSPCTYEIDSDCGGYLAVGMLTARVKARGGGRGTGELNPKSQIPNQHISNPQSLIPNPLFAVRTPTATVTDLGTEFGVEVEQSGATNSHVFQGKVELRTNSQKSMTSGAASILNAGESARAERGRNRVIVITLKPGQSNRFVRRMPSSCDSSVVGSDGAQTRVNTAPRSPLYRLTDLGTFGGVRSVAQNINAHGQVVGWAETPSGIAHAYLYEKGHMNDLGTRGDNSSGANYINVHGVVVGDMGTHDKRHAYIYRNGSIHTLPTLGGKTASAYAVNDVGVVVGRSSNSSGIDRAFIYTRKDGIKDLGALGGQKSQSMAYDINAAGMVVGCSEMRDGGPQAFLYVPGSGMKALGDFGKALSVNNTGHVVGYALKREGMQRAFSYEATVGMKMMDDFDGYRSVANDINKRNEIVGFACDGNRNVDNFHAFICRNGEILDLNLLIDSADGWSLTYASAINDAGQIVGCGRSAQGDMRAFLLTPMKEAKD